MPLSISAFASADESGNEAAAPLPFSLPIIQHLAEHRDLYGAFGDRGISELLSGELRKLALKLSKRDLVRLPDNAIPRELKQQFVVGAFTSIVAWWLDSRAKLPPEILDGHFQQIVRDGIARRDPVTA